jgi:hypothetical protein
MKRIYSIILIASALILLNSCRSTKDLEANTNCIAVSELDFYRSLSRVKDERSDEDKESIACRETRDLGCLTSDQIKDFAASLSFERNRLSYMRFAFTFCSDTDEYYDTLKHLLTFKSSKQALENWAR